MTRRFLLTLLFVVIAATLAGKQVLHWWESPLRIPEGGHRFTVTAGDTLRDVAEGLYYDGALSHPRLLMLYGRLTGLDQQIRQGEYLLPEFATAHSILLLLQSGKVIHYLVTFPEGITLTRTLAILRSQEGLMQTMEGSQDPRLAELVHPKKHPEGLFFPDSYRYVRGDSDFRILQRARDAMREVLEQEWANRAQGLPYKTPYEALIMASIVERETGTPEERSQIAGVFVRRLQRGMRLQTDPTVIYGLGVEFDGNLRRSHLADDSNPYNSYRHYGLPPTPIALPGRAAINAALHPAAGNTLYFVARGDGGHIFSATLAEHEKAVRKYQLRRRKDYRSSPAGR